MSVVINGENREIASPLSVTALLADLGLDARKIALEHNLEIVPRSAYDDTMVADGDRLEIVHFIGGGDVKSESENNMTDDSNDDSWSVAGRKMTSRLIVGTGKYKSYDENHRAVVAAGAEMVTVAMRRVNVTNPDQEMLVDHIDPKQFIYLPNTAGCFTGEDAVRTLRLAREAGGWDLVKLE
ncbi:MAG: sulfur carrier protein ThiS, partial [Rhodospirillaceae bacterium]|nr:sulfur carrier protein ThiS [Rhodospirillaceae bacterium]